MDLLVTPRPIDLIPAAVALGFGTLIVPSVLAVALLPGAWTVGEGCILLESVTNARGRTSKTIRNFIKMYVHYTHSALELKR